MSPNKHSKANNLFVWDNQTHSQTINEENLYDEVSEDE
jgi:hypothetical protein